MAKKRRTRSKKPKRQALGSFGIQAVKKAAETNRRVSIPRPDPELYLSLIKQPDPARILRPREPAPSTTRKRSPKYIASAKALVSPARPAQVRLPQQRPAVRQVLEQGKGLNRRQRKELQAEIPQHIREIICRDRKVRRQMIFATGQQGAAAGRRPKQRSIWSDVNCD